MPVAAMCPYFQYEKKGITHCECGELKFPDLRARRDIVYRYCAHPSDYQLCPFKHALDGYYERRYK
jgi:hypothetical protein